jgi:hypothetical protein
MVRKGVYTVSIYRDGKLIDSTTVPVGQWPEIGYWLDNLGYIETEYEIRVKVDIPL